MEENGINKFRIDLEKSSGKIIAAVKVEDSDFLFYPDYNHNVGVKKEPLEHDSIKRYTKIIFQRHRIKDEPLFIS